MESAIKVPSMCEDHSIWLFPGKYENGEIHNISIKFEVFSIGASHLGVDLVNSSLKRKRYSC